MAVDLTDLIDLDLLAYFKSKLDLLFAGKVDKEAGKGLSSNDYTSTEKSKLVGIAEGAQVNVLEGIQKNGATITPISKIANISVPTKTSDITNDSNFPVDANYVHTDNNYTTTEKTKLSGIAAEAQVNVIETVKVNNVSLSPSSKAVNITVPTKTSDITNDSGFITISDVPEGAAASSTSPKMDGTATVGTETAFARGDHIHPSDSTKVDKVSGKGLSTEDYTTAEKTKLAAFGAASTYYNKTEIDQLLTGAMTYKGTKATTSALPSSGNAQGDVWHVTADGSEWAWNGSAWEELGTVMDLSNYVEESEIGLATQNEIDGLFTTT